MSTQFCGCDPEANWLCEQHRVSYIKRELPRICTPNPDGVMPIRNVSLEEYKAQFNTEPNMTHVRCLDCGWAGRGFQLIAQACPLCDGRVTEESEPSEVSQ